MTNIAVANPYEIFTDINGEPLENGFIYIGETGKNAIVYPIQVFWDSAFLYSANQPIRTIAGYASRNGTPGNLFINLGQYPDYSIVIQNKRHELVYSNLAVIQSHGDNYINAVVDSYADLQAINGFGLPVYVRGGTAVGDGGAGFFEYFSGYAPGTYTTDNGITFLPTGGDGSAAWIRQYDGDVQLAWYLPAADGVTNDGDQLYAACATGQKVVIAYSASGYLFELSSSQIDTVLDAVSFLNPSQAISIILPQIVHTRSTIVGGSPYANKITIKGQSFTYVSTSAVTVDSQSAGDHRVTFTLSDATGFAVGGYAFVKNLVGTNRCEILEGIWEISNVSGSNVQLIVKARKATLPAPTITSGSVATAKTVIKVNDAIGIDVSQGYGGTWQYMALIGNGTGTGDIVGIRVINGHIGLSLSTAASFGVANFKEHGIYGLLGSIIQCFDSYSSGNGQSGLYCLDGSKAQATRIVCTGNGTPGIAVSLLSDVASSQCNTSGNGQRGISCLSATVTAATAVIYENVDAGIRAFDGAVVNATGSYIAGNTAYGIRSDAALVTGTFDFTGGNTGGNEYTENNGRINNAQKVLAEQDGGCGADASALADGVVVNDGGAGAAGMSIMTLEGQYGILMFGNEVDVDEASIRYRGTSNSLDFYTESARRWYISSSYHWLPNVTDLYDLGSTSLRIRAIHIFNGVFNQGVQVLGAQQTGVSAMTNVSTPSNLNADTVTVAELADIVGNLINKLRAHGMVTT